MRNDEPLQLAGIAGNAEIIGFRNLLVHGYDRIDTVRVIAVIERWLPRLIADARRIVAGVPESS